MTGAGDLLHVEGLLAAGEWQAAALHVRSAAQRASSRLAAVQWRGLCERVPADVRVTGVWPEALAWVGWRADDLALVSEAIRVEFPGRAVFVAGLVAEEQRWGQVLRVLDEAGELPGPAGVLGAQLRAGALFELGDPGAEEAFARALGAASGRDLGLVWLDLAYHRSRVRQDERAREAYAQALVWLRGDASSSTLAYANLGIACLRLNDLGAAEFALRDAFQWAGRAGGERHLSTVWRVSGGAGMQRNLPARALAAFERARDTATSGPERNMALRGMGRALMAAGQFDRALAVLFEALAEVPPGERHPLWLDVAVLHLLTGNAASARDGLGRAVTKSSSDGWRWQVIEAELLRREGKPLPPDFLKPWPMDGNWVREEARLFPELFALVGVEPVWARPRGVVVADGPIHLRLDGVVVPLAPHRHAASLLAFLVMNGGHSTSERVLEAIRLPGGSVRARKQELSRAVTELRDVLGWPDSVLTGGGLLRLTGDIDWGGVVYPPAERTDLFCEGRLDPWVLEWRQDNLSPLS